MSLAVRVFNSLEGTWTLARSFSNSATMEGSASFQKMPTRPTCLYYREVGTFDNNQGFSTLAHREYTYCLDKDELSVFFVENPQRLLHKLYFDEAGDESNIVTATATHLCECDSYRAKYEFNLPDKFTLYYSVKGPKKDYSIESVFRRIVSKQ